MSTGYTARIKDGISFEQFIMNCARAFGACISLRDDQDKDIPERFEVLGYHAEVLEKKRSELVAIGRMDSIECEAAAINKYNVEIAAMKKYRQEKAATKTAYEAMLSKVEIWSPPTPSHQGLRDFMIQQIQESIKYDCTEYGQEEIILKTGPQWKSEKLEELRKNIKYHSDNHAEEVERARKATEWIAALRQSLKT